MAERSISPEDLPSNSFKSKEGGKKEIREKKVVEKVITSKVTHKKKGLGRRIIETFTGEETEDVGQYILYDVLIPAFKNTLSDAVTGGLEMLLFGENRRDRRVTRDRGRSYVSYSSYYDRDDRTEHRRSRNRSPLRGFDDIVLDTRTEAEMVLNSLVDLIEAYGLVTVADFYDLIGEPSAHTDVKWGWDTLATARVERVRNGYILSLPRPIAID